MAQRLSGLLRQVKLAFQADAAEPPKEGVAIDLAATYDRAALEERLRILALRVRWRLIAGLISAVMAVALTLPVLASRVDPGATGEVIWPNSALTSEVIWPNALLTGGALGQG